MDLMPFSKNIAKMSIKALLLASLSHQNAEWQVSILPFAFNDGKVVAFPLQGFTTAWFAARTTLYTLTDRRIVMRIGVVLTLTLNLPLKQIAGAALKPQAGGHGDVALSLAGKDRIAFLNLWPHARPWQLKNPQPSLRCLPGAAGVGERIQQAWLAANPQAPALVGMPETAPLASPVSAPVSTPVARPVRERGMPSAA